MAQISYLFIHESGVPLSSFDLCWGWRQHLLTEEVVIEVAVDAVNRGDCDVVMVDLACLLQGEALRVSDIVARAEADPVFSRRAVEQRELTKRRWLYLCVFSAYRSHFDKENALSDVELVWCDFGHPASLSSLIRWMSAEDGKPVGVS